MYEDKIIAGTGPYTVTFLDTNLLATSIPGLVAIGGPNGWASLGAIATQMNTPATDAALKSVSIIV